MFIALVLNWGCRLLVIFTYLFSCSGSQLWHTGSSFATFEFLIAACGIQFPDKGLNLGPLALGAGRLSQWTTREAPRLESLEQLKKKKTDYFFGVIVDSCAVVRKSGGSSLELSLIYPCWQHISCLQYSFTASKVTVVQSVNLIHISTFLKALMPRPYPRPIESDSLEVGPRCLYFLKAPLRHIEYFHSIFSTVKIHSDGKIMCS